MAVFGSLELIPGEERTVQHKTAAHAGSDKEADNVFVAAAGAEMVLAQNPQIYVVSDIKGHAELLAHGGSDIIIAPGKVRGEEHDTAVLINDARGTGGDGVQLFPVDAGFLDHFLHDTDDDLFNIGRGVAAAFGSLFQAVDDLVLFVENGSENFGSSDIQTNVIRFGHNDRPPFILSADAASR